VREPSEVEAGTIAGARTIPLGELSARLGDVPKGRPLVIYCGHGERASTGVSLLERAGFTELINLNGGYDAWQSAG
jgi:rhodanese-related sulfurtransferase